MKTRAIRIGIIDDEPLIRCGIRSIVARVPSWQVVLEASSGDEAIAALEQQTPDVLLLDLSMPVMDGLTALPVLLARRPEMKVVVLSSYRAQRDVLEALAAGAAGYVLKAEPATSLLDAIVMVDRGQRYLSPQLPTIFADRLRRPKRSGGAGEAAAVDVLSTLTPREREIFRMVVNNHGNREIAQTLHISMKTVDSHRRRINDKLGCHSTAELVHFAALNGLLRPIRPDQTPIAVEEGACVDAV